MKKKNGRKGNIGFIAAPLVTVVLLAVVAIGLVYVASPGIEFPTQQTWEGMKTFSTYSELKSYLETAQTSYYGFGFGGVSGTSRMTLQADFAQTTAAPMAAEQTLGSKSSGEYSTTNIQVAGVDEADIVKTDGNYIYAVSGGMVFIIDAQKAEDMKIVAEIEPDGWVNDIFVNKDSLVVFSGNSGYHPYLDVEPSVGIVPGKIYRDETIIQVYDISDREKPELERNVTAEGNYVTSRMIGDYVYAVATSSANVVGGTVMIPGLKTDTQVIEGFREIHYFDSYDTYHIFTNIVSVNTQDSSEEPVSKLFLLGGSSNIFASLNNIYVTYYKHTSPVVFMDRILDEIVIPALPADVALEIQQARSGDETEAEKWQEISSLLNTYIDSIGPEEAAVLYKGMEAKMEAIQREIAQQTERTAIHKIGISEGGIEYKAEGDVPGNVLNQFSMDEYAGYFRVATTVSGWTQFGRGESENNVYVLDPDLNTVGKLERIAPGESIYSARFIGERVYLVTFERVDPFFVIDLSNPSSPQILGKLKIPGFSDYLHPYDENHIIGIGKDTEETKSGATVLGLKMALFDVSDVSNPIEKHKVVIGDRGTDSDALREHKAFLFDKEKELLVIPVTLSEINESENRNWGTQTFQGAYVYRLTSGDGFELKGRVTHYEEPLKGCCYSWDRSVRRSLYIGDALYTLSQKVVKANSLTDLKELSVIELPVETTDGPIYRTGGTGPMPEVGVLIDDSF